MAQDGGMTAPPRCPCGTGDSYQDCCQPAHLGIAPASTATALMRSRFTAFVRADAAYLLATWHPSTRPARFDLDDRLAWTRLEILDTTAGGPFDRSGVVEFRAHYRVMGGRPRGEPGELHERSSFLRHGPEWFYVSGDVRPAASGTRRPSTR
jgi:SEC-C motif-containing protein